MWAAKWQKTDLQWHPGVCFDSLNMIINTSMERGNARQIFAVTSAFTTCFANLNFIFDNDFIFADRFPPEGKIIST